MPQPSDPLEERDILKILDALDDPRVINKIAEKLGPLSTSRPKETINANKTS